jgi:hypothetical protein
MGALNWLNRLRKNESGNIIAIGAAAMPMLVGTAALAVDTIQLSLWKRQLQRTADSAAIAGAYSATQGRTTAEIQTSVEEDVEDNPHPGLDTPAVTREAWGSYSETVHVSLTANRELAFMSMFTKEPATIAAEARAALVGTGTYCMVSLYNGTDAGIVLGGGADIDLDCGVITNSRAGSAVLTGGNGSFIRATPVGAVGGINGKDNQFVDPEDSKVQLLPHTAPQKDPYADVPDPDPSCAVVEPIPTGIAEIQAGKCYSSLNIQPSDALTIKGNGPIYVVGGGADIKGDLILDPSSTGVTIVMTGNEFDADTGYLKVGNLTMHSKPKVQLFPPPSTDLFGGLVFYRDRRAAPSEIVIRGGASSTLKGGFYAANSNIDFAGHTGLTAECMMMVGQKILMQGSSKLFGRCPAGSDIKMVERTIVRLVA